MLELLLRSPKILMICGVLAMIPIFVYMWYFLRQDPEPRRLVLKTFLYGCLSVVPLALLQVFMTNFEEWNIHQIIDSNISNRYLIYICTFIFVGVTEEYAKHWVVKVADDKEKKFRTIADGIELSIIAALGFAFIEHIVYFVSIYYNDGFEGLIVPFIFRSIFTTFAHISFSGIYGYYYGKSHFLKNAAKRNLMVLRGLLSAMILHAIYNFVLEINYTFLIVPLLAIEFWFIAHEFKKKENREILIPNG